MVYTKKICTQCYQQYAKKYYKVCNICFNYNRRERYKYDPAYRLARKKQRGYNKEYERNYRRIYRARIKNKKEKKLQGED